MICPPRKKLIPDAVGGTGESGFCVTLFVIAKKVNFHMCYLFCQ